MNPPEARRLKKQISECRYDCSRAQELHRQYMIEKNEADRKHFRANNRNYSVHCLQVPSSTKNLDTEEYLTNIEQACCNLFTLILQDITGTRFLFEDEYEIIKDKIERINNGARITFFQFRNLQITEDEYFKIFETHKVFTKDNYNNIEEYLQTNYPDLKISKADFDDIMDFYKIQIDRIYTCSTIVNKKFPINNYTSYNKFNRNIALVEDLAIDSSLITDLKKKRNSLLFLSHNF